MKYEMLRVALVTKLARDVRLKVFEQCKTYLLREPLVAILARDTRFEILSLTNLREILRARLITLLARNMVVKIFNRVPHANTGIVTSGTRTILAQDC